MRKRDNKPAALDHALYEIEMLTYALLALCRGGQPPRDESGWLEVFAVHARNLNEFFAAKEQRDDGFMTPTDFVPWDHPYVFDRALMRRASNQVAHLTFDREKPEEKTGWALESIFKKLREPSLAFLKAVAAVEPLMAYHHNKARTAELVRFLPSIGFRHEAGELILDDPVPGVYVTNAIEPSRTANVVTQVSKFGV